MIGALPLLVALGAVGPSAAGPTLVLRLREGGRDERVEALARAVELTLRDAGRLLPAGALDEALPPAPRPLTPEEGAALGAEMRAGRADFLEGRFEAAIERLERAWAPLRGRLELVTSDAALREEARSSRVVVALAHGRLGRPDRAEEALAELLRQDPGFRPSRRELGPEGVALVDRARADRPRGGALRIRSEPAGASVYVAGRFVGAAPLTVEGLPPGPYEVLALAAGSRGRARRVVVREGTTMVELPVGRDAALAAEPGVLVGPLAPRELGALGREARASRVVLLVPGAGGPTVQVVDAGGAVLLSLVAGARPAAAVARQVTDERAPPVIAAPRPAASERSVAAPLVAGAGVLVAVGGILALAEAASLEDEARGTTFDRRAALEGDARGYRVAGWVGVGVGAAALVAGGAWWWSSGRGPRVSIAPRPGGLAVAVAAPF